MNTKITDTHIFQILAAGMVLGSLFLGACTPMLEIQVVPEGEQPAPFDPLPTEVPAPIEPLSGEGEQPPENPGSSPAEVMAARDAALSFLNTHTATGTLPAGSAWASNSLTAPGIAGGAAYVFTSGDWIMTITYPVVAPSQVTYEIIVNNQVSGFHWQGKVDAQGHVSEAQSDLDLQPQSQTYVSEDYHVSLSYPANWTLEAAAVGTNPVQGMPASQLITVSGEGYQVQIHVKQIGDPTVIGGALPPGEVQQDGITEILGQQVQRSILRYEGKTKIAWYAVHVENLEIYIRIENSAAASYAEANIPADALVEMEDILGTLTRLDETQEVVDWRGVIVANPVGAQFDDYFQMMDQDGSRYGIDSADETIRQQLASLRDTAQQVRVWGTLRLNVPDAYGGQIQVSRMELVP